MAEETSLKFRLNKIDKTRSYLLDEIEHIDLMSKKYERRSKYLNYVECLMNLKYPGFTYNAGVPFTKHSERIEKFRKTGNFKRLDGNELDKACFTHDAAYSDSKDLAKRTVSDKILKDRAYEIARNGGYDGYQIA